MSNGRNVRAENVRTERLTAALEGPLKRLINKRVLSPAHATREMDGRLIPFVLAVVFDDQRQPVAGLPLELRDAAGKVLDATRSSAGGIGILRFSPRKPRPPRSRDEADRVTLLADGDDVSGVVVLLDGTRIPSQQDVTIPPNRQVAKAVFIMKAPAGGISVQLPPGDDPITRVPIDFSEDACNEILGTRTNGLLDPNNLFTRDDPLLSAPAGVRTIAGKRLPLIRRLDIVRFADDDSRFLVRLRQEWVLLGYTLGELADVTALDPGAVLQSADQLVSEVSSIARDVVETTRSTLTQTLQDTLSSLGTVDSVVSTVANARVRTSTIAGGIGGILGPIFGGVGGVSTRVSSHLDLTVNTHVNTSLLVNRAVQQASTLINEAVSKARAVAEGTQRSATDVVNHLAPLISQVANALHWRVYEVYAVCTNVDAVHPIIELDLAFPELPPPAPPGTLAPFTADDVRAYRPFFEPALLDQTLVGGFDALTEAAELPPLTSATVDVTYDASFNIFGIPIGARITATVGGIAATMTVPNGTARTARLPTINFPVPVPRGIPLAATIVIAATVPGGFTSGAGRVRRVEVWVDRPLSGPGFIRDVAPPATSDAFDVTIGIGPFGAGVLLAHINRHLHYYYGILAAAAIDIASLRQDAPQLASIDADLWRLPLIGFEGDTALLIDDAATGFDAATLLDDPGAGTLVQILAPGSYGEMLTGLLEVPLDRLHPLLKEVGSISPFGAFPSLPSSTPTTAAASALGPVTSAAGAAGVAGGVAAAGLPVP